MKIVNIKEHLECGCYAAMPDNGFNILCLRKGQSQVPEDLLLNRFIYVMQGRVRASYGIHGPIDVSAGQFIFIPMDEKMEILAHEDSEMIVMTSLRMENICSKVTVSYLFSKLVEHNYTFRVYLATDVMREFFGILKVYLVSGLRCSDLHKIKERELLFLLRAGFTDEELIGIFCPVIGQSEDFKSKVLKYRKNAKTVMQLAERMGMGIDIFKRTFKSTFGTSPYQWMQQQKAEEVLQMLREDYPIKKISKEFKFTSQSHLTRFTEKYFGKTPKVIQNEAKNERESSAT